MRRSLFATLVLLAFAGAAHAQTPFQQYVNQRTPQPASQDPMTTGVSGVPQMAAGPQGVSADQAWDFLRERAMGVVKGCNYTEYLELANKVKSGWAAYENWNSWNQAREWAVPFMDMVSMLVRSGSVVAAKKSAETEAEGLVYQLEQVCNAVAQADEINRQYQILAAGSLHIDRALKWLTDATDDLFETAPGSARDRVLEQWATLYDEAIPSLGTMQDSLWLLVSSTLHSTLQATGDLHAALDKVQKDINETRDALILTADTDSRTGRFTCPEGYPDPNRAGVEYHNGRPVCGPVGPERSQQLLAQIELLKTQLKAIQLAADARGLEVDAVRLMADNYQRRMRHVTNAMAAGAR